MASQDAQQLHFILMPFMAQGHTLPSIDMARLIAKRGVTVTIIATEINASRFMNVISRAVESGLPIRVHHLHFPCQEAGLPEGCETCDLIPSLDLVLKFFTALDLLQQPVERFLENCQPRPSCMISDMCFPWTLDVARKFDIPRIVFHGTSYFSLLCLRNVVPYMANEGESVTHDSEPFIIPDIPHRIEITMAQLPLGFEAGFKETGEKMRESDLKSYAAVVNSFDELEKEYIDSYVKATARKAWSIGPVSLCNSEMSDKAERGNKASIDEHECLKWLDSKKPRSVLYVCFGSLNRHIPSQLIEIGLGLEASNQPFIWVIRESSEIEEWLSDGFEERIKEKGLIIRGWAPQILILSHPATGGFLTHCGWNSMQEGITAGIPMITWPLFAEQFLNEKFLVQVLRTGISVGVQIATQWTLEENVGVLVKMEDVKRAIDGLMDGGEEGEERRNRAREYGEKAKRAMEEGGSSHVNMTLFIEDIKNNWSSKDPIEGLNGVLGA